MGLVYMMFAFSSGTDLSKIQVCELGKLGGAQHGSSL